MIFNLDVEWRVLASLNTPECALLLINRNAGRASASSRLPVPACWGSSVSTAGCGRHSPLGFVRCCFG